MEIRFPLALKSPQIPIKYRSVFGLLVCIGFCSCMRSEPERTTPVIRDITESVYASGNIKALNQYEAFAPNSGPIQEIFVQEGDLVKVGTPILAIYNEREKLNRENAELAQSFAGYQQNQSKLRDLQLAIDLAKSKLLNDSLLYVRQQNLWKQSIGTKMELDQRRLAFESAQNNYQSSLLRYQDVKREIEFNSRSASKSAAISRVLESDFVLKSQINGRVYSLPKEKGEMVNPQTVVAVLGDATEFIMELQVDEYDIATVHLGQQVLISMDSYKGAVFEGKVTKIYPLMDTRTKSFNVEAVFTKLPTSLYPNLSLEANILTSTSKDALVIPRNYLIGDSQVILASEDTVSVMVGIRNFEYAQILEGIDEDTKLIKP